MKKLKRAPTKNHSTGLPSDYHADRRILAPIPGLVTQIFVKPGEVVDQGSPLLIIEAMKTRNMIRSSRHLIILSVLTTPGQVVRAGELLVEFVKDVPS